MLMLAKPLLEPPLRPEIPVRQWTFDQLTGLINAQDGQGNLVMTITAGPMFGPRLAAAFCAPPAVPVRRA